MTHIISWNVNGLRAIMKKGFLSTVQKLSPDILCLQETKAQDQEVFSELKGLPDYKAFCNSAEQKGYSGVASLYGPGHMPLEVLPDMGVKKHDKEGRILCSEHKDFYLVNVYVPNSGQKLDRLDYRKNWDAEFLNYLKELEKKKPVVICGDFNVAHRPIDLKNDKSNYNKTAGYTQVEIDGMDNFLAAGFADAFRHLHPKEVSYTYWSYRFKSRERNVGWRIDYFLVSRSLIDKVKEVVILPELMGSDHCPIGLRIDF